MVVGTHFLLDQDEAARTKSMAVSRVLTFVCMGIVFFIGLLIALGQMLNMPLLSQWSNSSPIAPLLSSIALLLLTIGYYSRQMTDTLLKTNRYLPLLCAIGLFIIAFSQSGFSRPDSLIFRWENSNIAFYQPLILILSGLINLTTVFTRQNSTGSLWIVQAGGLLILNISVISLTHYVFALQPFSVLLSLPESVAFTAYSLALLFSNIEISPFFSQSARTQAHTAGFFLLWLSLILWSAYVWHHYLQVLPLPPQTLLSLDTITDWAEAVFLTLLLGLGIHLINSSDRHTLLAQRLKDSFNRYATLAATLSHDLKAPLQTEIQAIDMIQNGSLGETLPEKTRRILAAVNDNNRYELELVVNLLDLLRYELKEDVFQPQPFWINKLLSDIQEELMPFAMKKEQILQIHPCADHDGKIVADPVGVKRILYNLINNAIQHLGNGHQIDVAVRVEKREFVFYVKDNGPGIASDVQCRLFERFNHSNNHKRTPTSSGLGLYVSQQIVSRHGGRIWIKSVKDIGTTVFFTLPKNGIQRTTVISPTAFEKSPSLAIP